MGTTNVFCIQQAVALSRNASKAPCDLSTSAILSRLPGAKVLATAVISEDVPNEFFAATPTE